MKQLISTIVLCTGLHMAADAQWTAVKPAYGGVTANDGAVSFVLNGKGYLVAGSSNNHVYEYQIAGDTWTDKGAVPAGVGQAFSMAFVLNNKAYLVGGDTGGVPLPTVWMYDPAATNPWTQKQDFAGGVRDAGIAFVINNTAYVGAGFDGANLHSDMWQYNAANDSWTALSHPMPVGLLFSSSFVINNKAYVIGGGTPPGGVNETIQVWEFDAGAQTWTAGSAFPGTARQAAIAFSNNVYGYYGGGMSGFVANYKDMWRYEPGLKQWKQVEDVPMLGASWSSVFVAGNTAYAGLGAQLTMTGLVGDDKFYKYTMSATNGVHDAKADHGISVYPNPATDKLRVYGAGKDAVLTLYDAMGRPAITATPGSDALDLSAVPAGLYLLRATDGEQSESVRVMKQ